MAKQQKQKRWKEEQMERVPLTPQTPSQRDYIEAIINFDTVISIGSAGTGKTYIAGCMAADMLLRGDVKKIVITRPIVSVGQSLGALPGVLEEKLAPWMAPVIEVLKMKFGSNDFDLRCKRKQIEFAPFEQIRGRTFDNAFVLLDEAQNCTFHELKAFVTRIGKYSKTVIDGDASQSDLRDSGLQKLVDVARLQSLPVPVVEFDVDDIVRSETCKMWIKAFNAFEESTPTRRTHLDTLVA